MKTRITDAIVFYDGECGLCHRVVLWVLEHDVEGYFQFCALQSELAQEVLGEYGIQIRMDTVYVLTEGCVLSKSDAALAISDQVMPTRAFWVEGLRRLPRWVRDKAYDWVAHHRKKLARPDACTLMRPEWKERFLWDDENLKS